MRHDGLNRHGKSGWSQARFRCAGETADEGDLPAAKERPESIRSGAAFEVCRQTVSRWVEEFKAGGKNGLKKAGRAGRKAQLTEADRTRLEKLLLEGPEKLGYETPLWTCARLAHLIEQEFGIRYHRGHVWKV